MEKKSEEDGNNSKKDKIFRADKIDLKSLDRQLEKHLSKVWSRNLEVNQKAKEEWEIDLAKLVTSDVIARGTYGTVYKGTYDGQDVAGKNQIKTFYLSYVSIRDCDCCLVVV